MADTCKVIVSTLINHKDMDFRNQEWENLLPPNCVQFLKQLDEEDYANDDMLYSIGSLVRDYQDKDLKTWEWYSSKVEGSTVQIVFLGWFSFRNYWMIHTQKIPYSQITVENRFGKNSPKVYKDVLTYKNFED